MPYFALFYDTVGDFVERRLPYRPQHLGLIDAAYREGRLVLAGSLKPDGGALLVFRTETASEVEAFATRSLCHEAAWSPPGASANGRSSSARGLYGNVR